MVAVIRIKMNQFSGGLMKGGPGFAIPSMSGSLPAKEKAGGDGRLTCYFLSAAKIMS